MFYNGVYSVFFYFQSIPMRVNLFSIFVIEMSSSIKTFHMLVYYFSIYTWYSVLTEILLIMEVDSISFFNNDLQKLPVFHRSWLNTNSKRPFKSLYWVTFVYVSGVLYCLTPWPGGGKNSFINSVIIFELEPWCWKSLSL